MTAIFAFKIVPNHYKPLNDDFIRLAKLSVKSAKKYYKTKFYCDNESLKFFTDNGILFDEVIIINDFIYDYENQYSITKIYAMMNEVEPYILLDFDVVLLEKLTPTHTITYGNREIEIDKRYINLEGLTWVYDFYVKPFKSHIKKYYNDEDLLKFDWVTYPSFCVVMVTNPLFMSKVFKTIFELISKEDIYRITPTLLEQFLSHQYVVKYNVDFGFVTEEQYYNNGDFDPMKLLSNKYVHLHINKPLIKEEIKYLEEIIK